MHQPRLARLDLVETQEQNVLVDGSEFKVEAEVLSDHLQHLLSGRVLGL